MEWISPSEIEIKGKVYHITNPEWIKNLLEYMEERNDNDTPKDQEVAQPS